MTASAYFGVVLRPECAQAKSSESEPPDPQEVLVHRYGESTNQIPVNLIKVVGEGAWGRHDRSVGASAASGLS